MENDVKIHYALNAILSKELADGGFGYAEAGPLSTEASAWAVLAIGASRAHLDVAARACDRLAALQQPDGRVSAVSGCDGAFWTTPLCILAWKSLPGYDRPIRMGIDFLLQSQGLHRAKDADDPAGHDTSIVGWPWVEKTHSWIEPTSLSVMALKANGYADHPRVKEAVRMILDRQLPAGGWNYGNTTVFGKALLPIPENTGQALCALGGMTDETAVHKSLRHLVECQCTVRTPMALAWMLQGLKAWSRLPAEWENDVVKSLALQSRYGPYDTRLLSQLVAVYFTEGNPFEIQG